MSVFEKLFGISSNPDKKKDLMNQSDGNGSSDQSDIEKAIAAKSGDFNLADCLKVSFTDIAILGAGFMQFLPVLQKHMSSSDPGDGLYKLINAGPGDVLTPVRKAAPNILGGSIKHAGGGKRTYANFIKADVAESTIDPAMMMMVAMLVDIEKKLDNIQKTTENIMSFLETDKQAEQQGNINVLNDSLENYKYNWNNQQYLQNHHMKALDIKQKAEQNIIFYQKLIAQRIEKIPSIHLDSDVQNSLKELGKLFGEYRMAVYMYGFSSFMEVMLLGNFLESYLQQVADKVDQYNVKYQQQFEQCGELIRKLSSGSVETQVVRAIGDIGKFLGKAIGDSPLLSQGPVDEWLQEGGQKLIEGQENKVKEVASMFRASDKTGSEMFVDSIHNMDMICNHTSDILFDKNTLYIVREPKVG